MGLVKFKDTKKGRNYVRPNFDRNKSIMDAEINSA